LVAEEAFALFIASGEARRSGFLPQSLIELGWPKKDSLQLFL
jgi:hypothetical protein